ncbi:MAG: hypothetical protein HOC91_12625 [Nitrospinaceae bacterium]|jgi:hypothetical protein|nr:hypothetical protein [Nitrospinaceae bacterium]MBT3434007.1 hypothetical protein [Nitrospinaceae bacterium]MBT3820717.1 hypothetical protein [Nitrospinaceae bacterium]MBT4093022.1 hypothetical protein [Nitrospinaceae bacterium]MBT4431355.1 hypothetical protein [Nitrospinaceae bacterium]
MAFVPTTPLDGKSRTSPPPIVLARGYAVRYLKNTLLFWGAGALFGGLIAVLSSFYDFSLGGLLPVFALVGAVFVTAYSIYRGGLALWDLMDEPVSIQGQVAEKSATGYWNRLAFLEDKHYLCIERGEDHRPLAYGVSIEVSEGWFLVGQGYHDIVSKGTLLSGRIYRRTRVFDSLVKI